MSNFCCLNLVKYCDSCSSFESKSSTHFNSKGHRNSHRITKNEVWRKQMICDLFSAKKRRFILCMTFSAVLLPSSVKTWQSKITMSLLLSGPNGNNRSPKRVWHYVFLHVDGLSKITRLFHNQYIRCGFLFSVYWIYFKVAKCAHLTRPCHLQSQRCCSVISVSAGKSSISLCHFCAEKRIIWSVNFISAVLVLRQLLCFICDIKRRCLPIHLRTGSRIEEWNLSSSTIFSKLGELLIHKFKFLNVKNAFVSQQGVQRTHKRASKWITNVYRLPERYQTFSRLANECSECIRNFSFRFTHLLNMTSCNHSMFSWTFRPYFAAKVDSRLFFAHFGLWYFITVPIFQQTLPDQLNIWLGIFYHVQSFVLHN